MYTLTNHPDTPTHAQDFDSFLGTSGTKHRTAIISYTNDIINREGTPADSPFELSSPERSSKRPSILVRVSIGL